MNIKNLIGSKFRYYLGGSISLLIICKLANKIHFEIGHICNFRALRPWPWIRVKVILSCITHQVQTIYQVS